MADHAVVFARSARKELQSLDPQAGRRILRSIETLVANPRPPGVVKLEGASDLVTHTDSPLPANRRIYPADARKSGARRYSEKGRRSKPRHHSRKEHS